MGDKRCPWRERGTESPCSSCHVCCLLFVASPFFTLWADSLPLFVSVLLCGVLLWGSLAGKGRGLGRFWGTLYTGHTRLPSHSSRRTSSWPLWDMSGDLIWASVLHAVPVFGWCAQPFHQVPTYHLRGFQTPPVGTRDQTLAARNIQTHTPFPSPAYNSHCSPQAKQKPLLQPRPLLPLALASSSPFPPSVRLSSVQVTMEGELLDYEEEVVEPTEDKAAADGVDGAVKKGYVGIHTSGFRDFLLKPELLKAIVDCGFEHPSEGMCASSLFVLCRALLNMPVLSKVTAFCLLLSRLSAHLGSLVSHFSAGRLGGASARVSAESCFGSLWMCLPHWPLPHNMCGNLLIRPFRPLPLLSPSPAVQHECIPQAILGMDVICQAKSGMGKTAVFVLATLQQLEPVDGEVSVLVMCHTRELAFQIKNEYDRFSKYMDNVRTSVFFGGVK